METSFTSASVAGRDRPLSGGGATVISRCLGGGGRDTHGGSRVDLGRAAGERGHGSEAADCDKDLECGFHGSLVWFPMARSWCGKALATALHAQCRTRFDSLISDSERAPEIPRARVARAACKTEPLAHAKKGSPNCRAASFSVSFASRSILSGGRTALGGGRSGRGAGLGRRGGRSDSRCRGGGINASGATGHGADRGKSGNSNEDFECGFHGESVSSFAAGVRMESKGLPSPCSPSADSRLRA